MSLVVQLAPIENFLIWKWKKKISKNHVWVLYALDNEHDRGYFILVDSTEMT